jgi:N-acetylglucosaminyl-diphospho-decaprenol L-rhamnosyltransferase
VSASDVRPAVSVIIVSYNSDGIIAECLEALGDHPDHEVIVIDNLSSDATVQNVRALFPWVRVIENHENAGFSRAVNTAAEAARGRALLLLNPDALISSEAVQQLGAHLDADDTIGAVAPLVGNDGGDVRVITAGRAPTIWRMFLHQSGLSRLDTVSPRLQGHYLFRSSFTEEPQDVDWTTGGCVMVRAALWRAEGGLSDRWFMYAEDIEFCLRLRAHGHRIVVYPGIPASHAIGGSSAGVDGRANPAWVVNLFDLYSWRMSRSALDVIVWKSIVLAGFAGRWTTYRIREAVRPARGSDARAQRKRYEIYMRALLSANVSPQRDPLKFTRW